MTDPEIACRTSYKDRDESRSYRRAVDGRLHLTRRTGTLRRSVGLLLAATVLGLASSACARVQTHFALPDLAMADPSFGPTIEAYMQTRVAGGNTVDLLLNGDQICPHLASGSIAA